MPRIWLEKRKDIPWWIGGTLSVFSVVLALGAGGGLLLALGVSPWEAYVTMFQGALGNWYGLSETVVKAIRHGRTGGGLAFACRVEHWRRGRSSWGAWPRQRRCALWITFCCFLMTAPPWPGSGPLADGSRGAAVNEIISTL